MILNKHAHSHTTSIPSSSGILFCDSPRANSQQQWRVLSRKSGRFDAEKSRNRSAKVEKKVLPTQPSFPNPDGRECAPFIVLVVMSRPVYFGFPWEYADNETRAKYLGPAFAGCTLWWMGIWDKSIDRQRVCNRGHASEIYIAFSWSVCSRFVGKFSLFCYVSFSIKESADFVWNNWERFWLENIL